LLASILYPFIRKNALEKIKRGAQHNPLHTILVSLPERLPYSFLLRRLSRDTDSGPTTIRPGRVLLDLAKLNPLGWDIMPRIREIKQAPERCIWVRFADLEQG